MSSSGKRERAGNLMDVDIVNSRVSTSEPAKQTFIERPNGQQQPGNIYGCNDLAGGKTNLTRGQTGTLGNPNKVNSRG